MRLIAGAIQGASKSIKSLSTPQLEPLEALALEARQLKEMGVMAKDEGEEEVSWAAWVS
jgi:hypothetical protein